MSLPLRIIPSILYLTNSALSIKNKGQKFNREDYGTAISALVMSALSMFLVLLINKKFFMYKTVKIRSNNKIVRNMLDLYSLFVIISGIINSCLVIYYYENNLLIDDTVYGFSVFVMTLNSLYIFYMILRITVFIKFDLSDDFDLDFDLGKISKLVPIINGQINSKKFD